LLYDFRLLDLYFYKEMACLNVSIITLVIQS